MQLGCRDAHTLRTSRQTQQASYLPLSCEVVFLDTWLKRWVDASKVWKALALHCGLICSENDLETNPQVKLIHYSSDHLACCLHVPGVTAAEH